MDEADQPLLQIPLAAIEEIVEQINVNVLNITNDEKTIDFFKNKMVIKLKEDFVNLFLSDCYSEYGLPDEYIQQVRNGEIRMDSNQLALKDFFHVLENQILYKHKQLTQNELDLEQQLNENPEFKSMLLNKMIIISCDDLSFKNDLINMFQKVIDIGENWF